MSIRAFIALLALTAGAAQAQETPTTRQLRAMSAGQADRQIRRDLLSILQPAGKIGTGNLRRIRGLSLSTQPYATWFHGLCRRDTVTISYAPTVESKAYEDTPIQPYGLDAGHSYYFVAAPHRADLDDRTEARPPRSPFEDECNHIPDDWRGWFSAEDPHLAMAGALAMQAAVAWAKQPGHELASCGGNMGGCVKDLLAAADIHDLDSIATCEAAAHQRCYRVTSGGFDMTIRTRDVETPNGTDIISVEGGADIVVT
jgi:hypothetical protein